MHVAVKTIKMPRKGESVKLHSQHYEIANDGGLNERGEPDRDKLDWLGLVELIQIANQDVIVGKNSTLPEALSHRASEISLAVSKRKLATSWNCHCPHDVVAIGA